MSRQIQILKNGVPEATFDLEDGTYTIGRAPDADIVLADNAVSKTHATLTIDNTSIIIKDSGSSNGLFFQGKKCAEKSFDNHFEIDIKPFTLRAAAVASPETKNAAGDPKIDRIRTFSINNIKISLFLLFSVTMLLTVIIVYVPLKQKAVSIGRQETLKTGILLARYLAEMNRPFLLENQYARVKTSPVHMEDGVVYAFVVDSHGRIIAPQEKQGDFMNWNGLSSAFSGAKLRVEDGRQNEKIIFYPVVQQDRTMGAAILGYAWQQSGNSSAAGIGALAICLIVTLFGVAFVMAHLLARAFLSPLQSLYEEVEMAIKNDKTSLNFEAPYRELGNLKRAFDRLLYRKTTESPADALFSKTPAGGMVQKNRAPGEENIASAKAPATDPSPHGLSKNKPLRELKAPWCTIDRENYTLLRFSNNFVPGLGTGECRTGMHIIEALESDIIPAVSQMIDSDQSEPQTLTCGGKTYSLRRFHTKNEKNNVTLVFEDTSE